MKEKFAGAWMAGLVFVAGLALVGDYNPFVVPLFMSTYLLGGNIILMALAGLAGLALVLPVKLVIKYGLIFLFSALLLTSRNRAFMTEHSKLWAAATAVITFLVDITFAFFSEEPVDWPLICCEAVMAFCLMQIYEHALRILRTDFSKIAVDSPAAVSVLILGATLFYGLPMELMDLFSVAEAVGVYLLFYVIYRFGIGLGSAWAAVSGLILAVETGKMEYLLFDLVATAVCSMLAGVLPFPKIGIVLGFAGTELAAYLGGWSYVLSETGIKAAASAAVVFLFTPASLMTYMDRRVQKGEIYEGSSEWGRMMMDRVGDFGKAFRRMEYTVAGAETGISFQEIGAVLEDFSTEFDQVVPMRKTMESAVLSELTRKRAVVKSMVMVKNKGEHYELYITLKMPRGRLLTASQVRQILEKHGKMSLRTMDVGRTLVSRDFTLLAFEETPVFHLDKAVRKMSKYQADTSGDGFLLEELRNGQELMLLSDGMGSGKEAAAQSDYLIHTLEDMLLAGFDREFTIKFLNSYLSRQNRGEIFATLDLLLLDCYTGYGRLYKQGAAATFVKRGDWIEVIKSTSLPVGIEEAAECEKSVKKFYENDIIIMVSDGVLEGIIFENKEDYMKELIRNTESVFAEEIAEDIMNGIRNLNGRKLKDDATVLVGVVQKNRKVI